MTLTAKSTVADVAFAVGTALQRAAIDAVLTGGACASLYTDGAYVSHDLDFILRSVVTQAHLDAAMATVGFVRAGDRYTHPDLALYVEFPPGPLAIGGDYTIKPRVIRRGATSVRALSPTDACLDRLAAFFHWDDRQSLRLAVEIAQHRRVNQDRIAAWSRREGHAAKLQEFRRELTRARRAVNRR